MMARRLRLGALIPVAWLFAGSAFAHDVVLAVRAERATIQRFESKPDADGLTTFWLPDGADAFVMPFSAGVEVDVADAEQMAWLKRGSPWELLELPLLGVRC